ncbi:hypothetical protein [Kocuria aegyptia]|uniref:Uncharacterized protein n=1 Tax=Kocuria aegyptia TaxID=330943 RepID=A0ABP4W7Y1_9MICC
MDLTSTAEAVAVAASAVTCFGLLTAAALAGLDTPAGETAGERRKRRNRASDLVMFGASLPVMLMLIITTLVSGPLESDASPFSFTAAAELIRDQALHFYLHALLWAVNALAAVMALAVLVYVAWQMLRRRRRPTSASHGLSVESAC